MALFKATQVVNKLPVMTACRASDPIAIVGDFVIPAAIASNDVVEMAPLPAGYVPVDVIVDNAALGATMTFNAGLLSGAFDSIGARTCGAEFMSAQPGQTAGIKRLSAAGGGRVAPAAGDRGVGLVFTSVAGATAGAVVRLTLLARPQVEGV